MDPRTTALESGLAELSLSLNAKQIGLLLDYLDLMNHWNKHINLTAVTDPVEQVRRHLLDSFSTHFAFDGAIALDFATGAGLPGIPLAILAPEREWHLLDNSTKRISFLRTVATKLKLTNLHLINKKVEDYRPDRLYPQIICRAFASLKQITHNAGHLITPDGSILAMKGQYPEQEIAELPIQFAVVETYKLKVPGLSEERHLVKIQRQQIK